MKKLLLLIAIGWSALTLKAQTVTTLQSPDGKVAVKVTTAKNISYAVSIDNYDVLTDCHLALTMDGKTLGASPKLKNVKRTTINETLHPVVPLKSAEVRNHCSIRPCILESFGPNTIVLPNFGLAVPFGGIHSRRNSKSET